MNGPLYNAVTIGLELIVWAYTCQGFRAQSTALKLFSAMMGLTFVSECIAYTMAVVYHNNLKVYNVYSIVQIVVIVLYFNYSLEVLRRKRIGYLLAAVSIILGILNMYFLQPFNILNSYFLIYEGILIISLCLFSFLQMLMHEPNQRLGTNPYFWLNLIMIFFWSITFTSFGGYDYVMDVHPNYVWVFYLLLAGVNFLCYIGIGLTYIFRVKPSDDHDRTLLL